jgi:hypothetical protein
MSNQKFFNSKDAAVLINTYGFSLFPVQGFVDGLCTCGNKNCVSPGKHPANSDGFKSATKNLDELKAAWAGRKQLNVGVATGEKSGIFVVDIDSADGEAALSALGAIPDTLTVKTGKGRHLYFKWPGEAIITKRGVLPGVDIRGDGGYVCGVGTNHYSGAVYQWENPLEQIANAPSFILDIALVRLQPKHTPVPLVVKKNPFSLYQNDGWSKDKAYDLLSHINPDCGYDEWIAIGMGIHSEGLGFDVWDNWSKSGTKYNANGMQSHWKSFNSGRGITFGTVVKMAQNGGWKPQRKDDYKPLVIPQVALLPHEKMDEDGVITEEFPEQKEPPPREFGLIYADEIQPTLDTSDFVEDLLCENQFSVIYGESNCGKTFFMLDLAMHVALGRPWRGKAVEQGAVIYAALEGGHGTRNRIVAFKNYFDIKESIPLAVIPSSINFLDPDGDILTLVAAIAKAHIRLGKVRLVVIDTLARAISGGDENSSVDMGRLVSNADYIRSVTGAHIAFIHHSGKDAVKGARGHSSLRAAVDTEIEISRVDTDSPSQIKIVKQREMEMIEDMAFRLERVELGENKRHKPVTSCVVLPAEVSHQPKEFTMNPLQSFIYDALIDAMIRHASARNIYSGVAPIRCVSYDDLRLVMEERGFKEFMATEKKTTSEQIKSATQTARLALKKAQKINFNKSYIWPLHDDENQ